MHQIVLSARKYADIFTFIEKHQLILKFVGEIYSLQRDYLYFFMERITTFQISEMCDSNYSLDTPKMVVNYFPI